MSTPSIPAGSMIVATVLQTGRQSGAIGARRMHADGPLGAEFFARSIVQRFPALFEEAHLPDILLPPAPLTFLLQVFLPDGQLLSFHASTPIEQATPRAALLAVWSVTLPAFTGKVFEVVQQTLALGGTPERAGSPAHRVH